MILTGKELLWPAYETISPAVRYLCGGEQGKLGTRSSSLKFSPHVLHFFNRQTGPR